jgi:hypothetical protein
VDIVIGARRSSKEFNVPHSSQDKPKDDNSPGKVRRSEELTDRQEVRDSRNRQRRHEVRSTPFTEVA